MCSISYVVRRYGCVKNLIKTPYYSPWFLAKTEQSDFGKRTRIPSERASQEEPNGAVFSFVVPPSEE